MAESCARRKNARFAKLKALLNIGHKLRKVYKLRQKENQARIGESKPQYLAGRNYFFDVTLMDILLFLFLTQGGGAKENKGDLATQLTS